MGVIAVVDYGVGNLMSVTRALEYLGGNAVITGDKREIESADAIILPGVGAFPDAAANLKARGLDLLIREQSGKKPLLGICVGMQLLFTFGTEMKKTDGLDLIQGSVNRIKTDLKLPQIGWNSLEIIKNCALTKGLRSGDYVYFVHSYCADVEDTADICCVTDYNTKVTAMTARGNIYGCQFHPEKSGDVGLMILRNFYNLTL